MSSIKYSARQCRHIVIRRKNLTSITNQYTITNTDTTFGRNQYILREINIITNYKITTSKNPHTRIIDNPATNFRTQQPQITTL